MEGVDVELQIQMEGVDVELRIQMGEVLMK